MNETKIDIVNEMICSMKEVFIFVGEVMIGGENTQKFLSILVR